MMPMLLAPTEMALRRLFAVLSAILATAWVVFYGLDPRGDAGVWNAPTHSALLTAMTVAAVALPWLAVVLLRRAGSGSWAERTPHTRALIGDADRTDTAGTTATGLHAPSQVPATTLDPVISATHRSARWAFAPLAAQTLLMAFVPITAGLAVAAGPMSTAMADRANLITTFAVVTGFLSAAAAVRIRWVVAYTLIVHVIRASLVYLVPWPDLDLAAFSGLQSLLMCLLILGRGVFIRQIAASVDRGLDRAAQAAAQAAAATAATAEAARIDGLVHDHILAALLIASRADHTDDTSMVRRSAAAALAALSEISAPLDEEPDDPTDTTTPLTAYATTLFTHIHTLDPTITTTGRGHLDAHQTIPTTAATTLTAATLEALRNSLNHAAGPTTDPHPRPVRRTVTLTTAPTGVTITITDDGTGFDPTTATTGRYGVTGSILGRMDTLDGGHAHLETSPGRGTTITLTYTPPGTPDPVPTLDHIHRPTGLLAEFRRVDNRSPAIAMGRRLVADAGEDVSPALPIIATSGMALGMAGVALTTISTTTDPVTHSYVALFTLVACSLMAFGVARDPARVAPRAFVIPLVPGAVLGLALLVPGYTGSPNVLAEFWMVTSIYLVILYLAIDGYPVLATSCASLASMVLAVWGVVAGMPDGWLHGAWPMFFLASAMVSSYQVVSIRSMGEAAAASVGFRAKVDDEVRDAAAQQARRLNARRVETLARPLLERLAAGERTGPAVRSEAALLEARLRDDLRARCFRTTDVTRAAHDARARGLHVELLDDGALDPTTSPLDPTTLDTLRHTIITAAVHALDTTTDGAVIIRVAPPGRDHTATIVTRPLTTPPSRLEIPTPHTPGGFRVAVAHDVPPDADEVLLEDSGSVKGGRRP